jgi:3-dehydroquinate dehydratase-2
LKKVNTMAGYRVLLLNGPNLNLLGSREPEHYGNLRLEDVVRRLMELEGSVGEGLSSFQSNAEHELIDRIHMAANEGIDFIIINPAAFTHTSIALRDALKAVAIPFIEVHVSNIYGREDFRRHSYFSDIAVGVISGLGPIGYELALRAAVRYLEDRG